MRKYAIVGSRDFPHLSFVRGFIDSLPDDSCVISGNARGVDKAAQEMALARQLITIIVPAKWEQQGKGAGFIRNKLVVQWADEVVAFWDGKSPGTEHTIELAKSVGKPVKVFDETGELVAYYNS